MKELDDMITGIWHSPNVNVAITLAMATLDRIKIIEKRQDVEPEYKKVIAMYLNWVKPHSEAYKSR